MPNFFSVSPYSFMKIDGNLNHFVKLIEGNFRVPKSSFFDFFVYFFEAFFYDFSKKNKKNVFCSGFLGAMQVTCESLFLTSYIIVNSIKP